MNLDPGDTYIRSDEIVVREDDINNAIEALRLVLVVGIHMKDTHREDILKIQRALAALERISENKER